MEMSAREQELACKDNHAAHLKMMEEVAEAPGIQSIDKVAVSWCAFVLLTWDTRCAWRFCTRCDMKVKRRKEKHNFLFANRLVQITRERT